MLEVLIFSLFCEIGFMPDINVFYGMDEQEKDILELYNKYYTEIGIDLTVLDYFFIKGSTKVFFYQEKHDMFFYPDIDHWTVAAGLRYNGLEIGYEHQQFNPAFSFFMNGKKWKKRTLFKNPLPEGSTEKIYLRFEMKGE